MQTSHHRALVVVLLAFALALIWLRPIDATAQQYVDSGFKRALVTFAAARSLNALLSFAQGASISFSVGAGASVHPGAVLDPLDDLVEQFSTIMLAVTLSFAAQRLLIEFFSVWPVCVFLSVLIAAWAVYQYRTRAAPPWLSRASLGLLILSLAVPIVSLGSEASYRMLFAQDYESAQAQIEIADTPTTGASPSESYAESFKRFWAQSVDAGKQVEALRAKAANLVEQIVRLLAVFIVQTIVLPLLFLWLLFRLYRGVAYRQSAYVPVLPHRESANAGNT